MFVRFPGGGTASSRMSGRRISKGHSPPPGDIVMAELWVPPPVIERTSFVRGRAVAWCWTIRTAASLLKLLERLSFRPQMLRQDGSDRACSGYMFV
ncbi:hypothetical protein AVEN_177780-1 [Araneus ventricosus]|uniref:Uncharacterized protein n=1 Tax=Araneus ventricosus TaxID=182803 RepID=A0A4Y2NQD7_ARAVE|nr:hypothetical protein AVEN_97413-1 [Araneus ventricosus]GBN39959.1 hypothetical protein AVEN_59942-1 [Araneus ventricosus]GBN39988.1 hypothetical protein AVEN_123428-1 [Araneus ventricosus]GBN40025.1 hypothetical protein AVEN_177780-1 [Araneus ventricosus]